MADILRARIQLLEIELAQVRLATNSTTSSDLPGNPESSSNPVTSPLSSPVLQTNSLASGQNLWEVDTSLNLDKVLNATPTPTPRTDLTASKLYRYIFQIDSAVPAYEQSQDMQLSLACDWARHLPQLPNVVFSRREHDTLLLRCFKYGTSWLMGLVPELFLRDMLHSLTPVQSESSPLPSLQHYSPILHCSIMAFAAAFSDDPVIRAPETRARFASWAKQWVDDEFKYPVMSLVRSMVLLAEYHCGVGEKDAGYMYMGTACRAIRMFSPNNSGVLAPSEVVMDFPHSMSLTWHFWSVFCHDKLMALEYNINYDLPVPRTGITLLLIDDELDNQPWPLESSSTQVANSTQVNQITATLYESSKLMMIASRVVDLLHRQRNNGLQEHVVLGVHLYLDSWFNNLPEELLVRARSASPLPHLIALHMCYWWLLIVLHRQFYRKDHSLGSEPRPPITELSTNICNRAAHKIVQLVGMFEDQHGLRFFPRNMIEAICACGTTLIWEYTAAAATADRKRSNAINGIAACIGALRATSITWPYAQARADDLYSRLQDQHAPGITVPQADGSITSPLNDPASESDLDDAADISDALHQYISERGRVSSPQIPDPADPGSQPPSS
ncbi:hypothetical protein FRC12_013467 [Ceratobasidium sp. 428]|nr:hypothetical protein FRC12_013467 [Ceratobasidium sp. 428]